MCFEDLKNKALSLPLSPGVYIMKDAQDRVIYVGKAKKLKNRVSQYFHGSASHSAKTRLMVSKIDHFDIIVAASEFEALILECSLIKHHQPKYNILLKDDKGYPYVRLDLTQKYPVIQMASHVENDGAEYFGPFGSRGTTQQLIEAIRIALKLPACNLKFPRDVGKKRPCLNFHMHQCAGWCQTEKTQDEYRVVIEQARQLLDGNYQSVARQLQVKMQAAADELHFELAACLRDQLSAVETLGKKQLVTAVSNADTDVIGYFQTETKACFSVLHFSNGALLDKECMLFSAPDHKESAVSSLVKQYYLNRGFVPKVILLPFQIEDREVFELLLRQQSKKTVYIKIPQKGENARLVALGNKNAEDEAVRATDKEERTNAMLTLLGRMIGISPPMRIESYDISNLAGTDIVASMVVYQDGRPKKGDYKRFKISDLDNQDDYASVRQVLKRRFSHYLQNDIGFDVLPDLLLIDGGVVHAQTAQAVLVEQNLDICVLGMVKDERHRTRALVTPEGQEIRIDGQPAVFSFIGNIQEETHRFAINYNKMLRSKRLQHSELDQIDGIGPQRKQMLLRVFKSIRGIKNADLSELERYLPQNTAWSVYAHFHNTKGE